MKQNLFNPAFSNTYDINAAVFAATQAGITHTNTADTLETYWATQPPLEETISQLVTELAHATQHGTDLTQWHSTAAETLHTATSRHNLINTLRPHAPSIRKQLVTTQREHLIERMKPYYQDIVNDLTERASSTPGVNLADQEQARTNNAREHYLPTKEALTKLEYYVSSFATPGTTNDIPPFLTRVLPLMQFEQATPEIIDQYGKTTNTSELTITHAIRQLAQDLQTDSDHALVKAAAGHYHGITLNLQTTLHTNINNVSPAFKKTRVGR